jgi:hypothetical protein
MKGSDRPAFAATILALGLIGAGAFIGHGFASGRARDRYVGLPWAVFAKPARAFS